MKTLIFTDGASSGNPGKSGWAAVIVKSREVKEIGGHEPTSTNNRMEMAAVINALKETQVGEQITIYTDSQYLVNGITNWIRGWQRNSWKTQKGDDVLNKDLWQEMQGLVEDREIDWKVIRGHAGIIGNNRADEIAVDFSVKETPKLFHGLIKDYHLEISVPTEEQLNVSSSRDRSKSKAFSYLSLVDGAVKRHETWSDCEARVKGIPGAKFRKTISREDEKEIVKKWGFTVN